MEKNLTELPKTASLLIITIVIWHNRK